MTQASIRTVLVAGAGSIGIGVARSMRSEGYRTLVLSRNPARLQGQVEGAELISQLPVEAPDLVVECLPEVIELKHRFYAEVESAWNGAPILATNTSSLSF